MAKTDSLGDRMKRYEVASRNYLTRRIPVIIRLDGKAFHSFTKGMKKPFDDILMGVMQHTMKYLCENIQGCVLGYTQSDEITLVLTDYASIDTDAWFKYNVQKMVSVAASMATVAFNRFFMEEVDARVKAFNSEDEDEWNHLMMLVEKKYLKAMFDARAFSVPRDEVANCLIWRQQDAVRNSIQSVGQANFSHRQLHGKSCNQIQDMLFTEKGINWNDLPADQKRGACCMKTQVAEAMTNPHTKEPVMVQRSKWVIDREIPTFTQDRDYIEKLI